MASFEIKINSTWTESLSGSRILTNDITFPHEYNPHNVRLWLIGNEFGAVTAVWADCVQDALNEAVDGGMLEGVMISEKEWEEASEMEREEWAALGNAGEPHDLTSIWIEEIDLTKQSMRLIVALATARAEEEEDPMTLEDYE